MHSLTRLVAFVKKRTFLSIALATTLAASMALFTGCGSTSSVKTIATNPGVGRVDGVPVTALTFNRGDKVTITGSDGGYYWVEYAGEDKTANAQGKGVSRVLVEKRLVRAASEEREFESYTVYTKDGAQLFANAYFEGDVIAEPDLDTEVEVLDVFDRVLLVKLPSGETGYMSSMYVGTEPEPEVEYSYGYGYGYGGGYSGGYSGGSSGWEGGEVDTGTPDTGSDGDDISLASLALGARHFLIPVAYADEVAAEPTGEAMILADGTRSYLGFIMRDQAIAFVAEPQGEIPEGQVQLLMNDMVGLVPANFVRSESEAPYEAWVAYTDGGSRFFSDFNLNYEEFTCGYNDEIEVLDNLGSCILVRYNDTIGYMYRDSVSEEPFEEPEEPVYYGGGYSGGYSGGYGVGGNTGSSDDVIGGAIGGWTGELL